MALLFVKEECLVIMNEMQYSFIDVWYDNYLER